MVRSSRARIALCTAAACSIMLPIQAVADPGAETAACSGSPAVQTCVGTPRSTFTAKFRAAFTPVAELDADTYYDWSLDAPAACDRRRRDPAKVTTIVGGRPIRDLYDIRKGDLITYRLTRPAGGWCNGTYRLHLAFVGADVAGCPDGSPPDCDPSDIDITIGSAHFRVAAAGELPATGFDAPAAAALGTMFVLASLALVAQQRRPAGGPGVDHV